jgi:catechol 2,3-dioxygenase-like lactoylglutathione lyase family enzyme
MSLREPGVFPGSKQSLVREIASQKPLAMTIHPKRYFPFSSLRHRKEKHAMLKFMGPLYVVDDIAASRHFYEGLLNQKVKFDFGENVTFEGDFSIHLKSQYLRLLGDVSQYPVMKKAHNGELVFETAEIEAVFQRLREADVEFIHVIREQPWGQRVMRLYDLDGHILEIGEQMEAVVWRFYQQDWSIDRIHEKSGMPREFIERVIQEHDTL